MADQPEPSGEQPPFWGSWNRIYGFVIVFLFVCILLLFGLTRYYS